MARAPTMVIQDDYIDMDLTPSSPKCALLEFEFQSGSGGGGGGGRSVSRHREEEEAAYSSPADELFYRGKLLPLHLPPRLQLVQKLLQEHQQVHVPEIKAAVAPGVSESASASGTAGCASAEAEDGGAAKAGAKRYSWSKRLKLMKRWTSREYIKSLFLARPGDMGVANGGCGRERAGLLDQDELCTHRRSFSGIIRRVRLVVATKAAATAPPGTSPLCSSSASSSSSSTPSCGNAERFFLRPRPATTTTPVLKRSSSAGSEEGAIQGAIAHCKRSHQQLLLQQGRKSASGVVFYSVSNTPRISTSAVAAAAAANESSQERQEMCRG